MKDKVDVLVAGAGPGGLAAALALREAGADVALVDARTKIGRPLRCAELVPDKLFDELNLPPSKPWVRCRVVTQSGPKAMQELVVLDRERLEYDVSRIAEKRGVAVAEGTSVTGVGPFDGERREVRLRSKKGQARVAVRCVIAADGVSSYVARTAGLDTALLPDEISSGLAYQIDDASLKYPETVYMTPLPPSIAPPPFYYWVAPNGPRSANVGLALPGRDGNKARRVLKRLMREDEACSGGRIVKRVVGLIPFHRPLEVPLADGLLVVGGAARMVDPISGAGILFAAAAGRAAAKTVAGLAGRTASKDALGGYRTETDWIYKWMDRAWRILDEGRVGIHGFGK